MFASQTRAALPLEASRPVRLVVHQWPADSRVSNIKGCKLAVPHQAWQFTLVKKGPLHRYSTVLGMLAMLGALLVAPVSTPMAIAMANTMAHSKAATATAAEMPCHQPAKQKHCPDCPQKVCADMTACLAKCFQPLAVPVAPVRVAQLQASATIRPGVSQAESGSLIPPLLRPPSV